MIFVGIDWAEDHHEMEVQSASGKVLAKRQVAADLGGLSLLQEILAGHYEDPREVIVGIESNQGLLVNALVGSGYQVYPVNPLTSARAREGDSPARAKSDRGDAHVLANLVRTRRQDLRPLAGDSEQWQAVHVRARTHLRAIRTKLRLRGQLRAALGQYFPAAVHMLGDDDADFRDALAVLSIAATPEIARRLSINKLMGTLTRHGRQRNVESKAAELQALLRVPQLELRSHVVLAAHRDEVIYLLRTLLQLQIEIEQLEQQVTADFELHPDAEIIRSLPGLGPILGARVLGESGDDPTRYKNARARKNYAGNAPITKSSGKWLAVTRRIARNRRLADASHLWATSAINASPGARLYYDQLRGRGKNHNEALRTLANRLVGILHGCLRTRRTYDESVAWPKDLEVAA